MDLQGLVLSLLLWSHSQVEVVDSVLKCTEFFLLKTPPQIPDVLEDGKIMDQNRYKPICQTYANQRRFFTLYDTTNKIPVFSAYIFKGNEKGTCRPKKNWRTEPQLYENQATDKDYTNSSYDRGHLFPCSYGCTQEDKKSTFTLTNAVPQVPSFNQGSWKKMEECVKCVMEKYCKDNNDVIKGYLVTGAEPGKKKVKNKINIPSVMWSAFCCYSSREQRWLASAHWGDNVPDTKGQFLETRTLNQLYAQFRKNTEFKLFNSSTDKCPLDNTVTQFYPDINAENKNCNCPPINSPDKNLPDNNSPDKNSDKPDDNAPDDNAPDKNSDKPDDNAPDDNAPDVFDE